MTSDFFRVKRPWSHYKDFLLQSYLEPYIPKVARLKRPILIVDCFAGRGRFEDGEHGSPLIIAEAIKKWRHDGKIVCGEFIEADAENFLALCEAVEPYAGYCTPRHGTFNDHLPSLAQRARSHTVFLYIDPYSVRGLVFSRMKQVFDQIQQASASVEILLNFNVVIFMRWALAALQRHPQLPDEEESDHGMDDPNEAVEVRTLNEIAGGDYWTRIAVDDGMSFADKINGFMDEYLKRMLGSFRYVCAYDVKEKYKHQVPKYELVFATRHPDGLELMNDFMCKARRNFLSEFSQNRLFDCTPADEVADPGMLAQDIVRLLIAEGQPLCRPDVRLRLMREGYFVKLTTSEMNVAIGELLKQKRISSETDKTRINDSVRVSHRPF
ncbi:MAG: three-Cys-motif partner protein TcmP [Pirellulaceae bacterium]